MYQVFSFKKHHEWEHELKQLLKKDVYFFWQYCSLYETLGEGEPYLFVYKNNAGDVVLYTFIKRTMNLPFIDSNDQAFYDIITPYGFGGPLYQKEDEELVKGFRMEFEEFCKKENIISEFIRFNPLLNNHKYLNQALDVKYDRETIYIDLTKDEEEILANLHQNHKRNLNKARNNKLEFRVLEGECALKHVPDFYKLYQETMDKLNASSYYYFSEKYMEKLINGLLNNSMIGAVFYKGEMISAALCMYEGGYLHYHLGCSKKEFLHLGTNVFQFYYISLWAKQMGFHAFHLGGGHVGRDSLFEFKYRFNPTGTLQFFVGRKIHNDQKYSWLIEKWKEFYNQEQEGDFFPAYRKMPKKVELTIQG